MWWVHLLGEGGQNINNVWPEGELWCTQDDQTSFETSPIQRWGRFPSFHCLDQRSEWDCVIFVSVLRTMTVCTSYPVEDLLLEYSREAEATWKCHMQAPEPTALSPPLAARMSCQLTVRECCGYSALGASRWFHPQALADYTHERFQVRTTHLLLTQPQHQGKWWQILVFSHCVLWSYITQQ